MDKDRSELLVRHDEGRSQNHGLVVLTPITIMAMMAKAMIKTPIDPVLVGRTACPPHSITSSASNCIEVGTATPAPFADQPGLRSYQCSKCGHTLSMLSAR